VTQDAEENARVPPICSENGVADVTAAATPNGVICAHMPAAGVCPSDAEVAGVPVGLRIESGRWA
jgi:hypothetical protein